MEQIDINQFMRRIHAIERHHRLFEDMIDGEPWWDTVRYHVCCYLFECLANSPYAASNVPVGKPNILGAIRRAGLRQLLYARSLARRDGMLAIRAPRLLEHGKRRDAVLDPVLSAVPFKRVTLDTLPRRYHLPDFDIVRWPGTVPRSLPDILRLLLSEFELDLDKSVRLDAIVRRARGEFALQVEGYRKLFAFARPRAVVLLQNGIDKGLFHVARDKGVPTIEAQHGVVSFGHPQYSYASDLDYNGRAFMPDVFLTFSDFWQRNVHYPARRQVTAGTDAVRTEAPSVRNAAGTVMVCSANIYHETLMPLIREVATRMPHRPFIYKLHPNQRVDEASIVAEISDLPNMAIGSPDVPAQAMIDEVSHVVAVQSTVVYEALQLGRAVSIVPRLDYAIHADVFGYRAVTITDTVDELAAALSSWAPDAPPPTFFDPFDGGAVVALMASLAGRDAERADR